jgi:SAM-dependent methyltransferase
MGRAGKAKPTPHIPPAGNPALENLRTARGDAHIDWTSNVLRGYILLPDVELDSVEAYVNGTAAGTGPVRASRPDVPAFFRNIPHAARSGYRIQLRPGRVRATEINRVAVVGRQNGRPVARLQTLLFGDGLIPDVPIPPPELIEKMQGGHDRELYRVLGFRYCHQLRSAISWYRDPGSVRRLLDWGCGSGRVAANFLAAPGGTEVAGCDIDPDAIAWCKKHLPRGEFTVVDPREPLPYPDASFDAIVSLAVLAGFGPDEYAVWLPEVRRVLAPGGLLLASVQGAFAASFEFPPATVPELLRDGIFDGGRYDAADSFHTEGQWRGYYLTADYVRREWAKYFEVLEYLEGEINADQDLVVVRRTA